MKTHPLIGLLAFASIATTSNASLWVDFNATNQAGGPHNQAGYQAYDEDHEDGQDGDGWHTGAYSISFLNTGPATVSLTPDWPNTADLRVEQMIDRTDGWNANWTGSDLDLLRDFIGIDTRTGNGGNGDWDGTTGTPTHMTFTLGGLAADTYSYTSFHHDTEKVWGEYTVEISTDGGTTWGPPAAGAMTSSSPGAVPPNPALTTTGTAETLSSTFNTTFAANGTDDVVVRYAVLADTGVHRQIFGVNGFQLEQIPEPSTGLLGLLGFALLGLHRRR